MGTVYFKRICVNNLLFMSKHKHTQYEKKRKSLKLYSTKYNMFFQLYLFSICIVDQCVPHTYVHDHVFIA